MASLFIDKVRQFETTAGAPAQSYYLHFLTVGTLTPANTYPTEADAIAGTNANANPITLNASGRSPVSVWLTGRRRWIFSNHITPGSGTTIDEAIVEDFVGASNFQTSTPTYGGNNSGTADALVFTFSPAITAYTNGAPLRGRIAANNTGAVTINGGGGVKSAVKWDGSAFIADDLQGPDILDFTYDSTTDVMRVGTPTYNKLARLDTNQSFTKAQGVNRSALTDAATIAVDASLSNVFTVTLGGNRTLGQPTNPKDGQSITIFVTQDGTGSRTLAYHADWLFAGGVDPTLTTTAAAVDVLSAVYNGATTKWYGVLNKAFA